MSPLQMREAGAAFAILAASSIFAAGQVPTYRTEVEIVRVPVTVLGDRGEALPDLTVEDFEVRQDGDSRPIQVFLRPDDAPLDLVLALDVSRSTTPRMANARAAALAFLDALGSRDCVYVMPFDHRVPGSAWGAPQDEAPHDRIERADGDGGTALWDALIGAVDAQEELQIDHLLALRGGHVAPGCGSDDKTSSGRRGAIVIVTDGTDSHSLSSGPQALDRLLEVEVPLFVLQTAAFGGDEIERMTELSGGRRMKHAGGSLVDGYREVLVLLRSSYLLGYVPGSLETEPATAAELPLWRQIQVKVPGAATVFARPGYYTSAGGRRAARADVAAAARELLFSNPTEGLRLFDSAVASDVESWDANFQRGVALMRGGKLTAARESFLRAAEIRPGTSELHIARVSRDLGDINTAWEYAIRAYQAGLDSGSVIDGLRRDSTPPPDLDLRLLAPTMAVVRAWNDDPEAAAWLRAIERRFSGAVIAAPGLGRAATLDLADWWLSLEVDRFEPEKGDLRIDLHLHETGSDRVRAHESIRLSSNDPGVATAEIERVVTELTDWLERNG